MRISSLLSMTSVSAAALLLTLYGMGSASAVSVSYSIEDLATDGSNIDNYGIQHVGESLGENDIVSPQGSWGTNNPDTEDYGGSVRPNVNILLNNANYSTTLSAGDYDRNRKFEPYGTSGVLHNLMEGAMFSGSLSNISFHNLIVGKDYRAQFFYWDNEVEGEGDTKEPRPGFMQATGDTNLYSFESQTVTGDGDTRDQFFARIVTAEWTADATDIEFLLAPNQSLANDHLVVTGFVVHLLIPEPTTLSLCGLGLAGVFATRRRFR